ncbi:ATP-binding protein [Agrococcus sp. ARC_14]|uniref:sensor histidine kinase n=1 Tax=Agrococcus sp. ARC_14 TaxID=2919927 RepID=UPI001F065A83|nr:ATP-binding protein [Agrococcus sp. ARC_14]MCH1882363.1 ATP-binding protein [Agrococcus sp. ARC_14]
MRRWWRSASIATRVFVQTAALLAAAAIAAFALLALDAQREQEHEAALASEELALAMAATPTVRQAVASAFEAYPDDREGAIAAASAAMQHYVEDVRAATRLDFVTVMHVDGTRYTHPDPDEIGHEFLGTTAPALAGETFTEVFEGTLGPSMRAVTPIVEDGRVVGLVAAGVTIERVGSLVVARLLVVGALLVGALLLAALGAWLLARRLERATGGKAPEELARLFAAHEAALHSVDDGLVLIEGDSVVLANDRARSLLGVGEIATPIGPDAPLPPGVRAVLEGEGQVRVGDRWLVVERHAAAQPATTTLTIRDRTELQQMTGELDAVRTLASALRAQTHEFGNRMHTVATLIELDEPQRALEVATAGRDLGQRLADRVVSDQEEPVIAALLLGKAAQAHERGVEMHVETHLAPGTHGIDPVDFVTVLGNLVDNAIDAAADRAARAPAGGGQAWVEVYLDEVDESIVLQVSDSGAGLPAEQRERAFAPGWSTKPAGAHGRGFGLSIVRETLERLGGTIEFDAGADGASADGAGELGAGAVGAGAGAVVTATLPRPGGAS